ncbi:hypothetical protein JCM4914_17980 [Streptomyces platensis subsp. malvinus]
MRAVIGERADGGEPEQRGHHQMEAAAQDPQDGGEGVGGHGFFGHGLFRLRVEPACGINRRVDAGAHLSISADHSAARCHGALRRATVGASRRAPGPAPVPGGWPRPCSSPGEI